MLEVVKDKKSSFKTLVLPNFEIVNMITALEATIRHYSRLFDDADEYGFDDYAKEWKERIADVKRLLIRINEQVGEQTKF